MTQEEEDYVFLYELGRALHQWSVLEAALVTIVAACKLVTQSGDDLVVGYLSIDNFRAKLLFIDAVFKRKYGNNQSLVKNWEKLSSRISSLSTKRNQIAHGMPVRISAEKSGKRMQLLESLEFHTHGFGMPKTRKPTRFSIIDIAEQAGNFTAKYFALENFACTLLEREKRFPESDEQPPRRQTIRQIEARMRVALGRQPRPPRRSRGGKK